MPTIFFLGALIILSSGAVADPAMARRSHMPAGSRRAAMPTLNIEAGCHDVANMDLNKTTNYSGCIAEERDARSQLQKEWTSFSEDKHAQCMQLVTFPAIPSYVTLQECLHTARDAENLSKSNPSGGMIGEP